MKRNSQIRLKTPSEIKAMAEGGKRLGRVKNALREAIREAVSAAEVEELADKLIRKEGGKPSFKMVPGYRWATCINVNAGVVHGIPHGSIIFTKGDVVSVDVGMFYKGFHTDTSFTVGIDVNGKTEKFINTGKRTLKRAVQKARVGNKIYDISSEIEATLTKAGYSPIRALVGHGVGRDLHEDPQIPCFTNGDRENSPPIAEGAVLAIEVMYTMGESDVSLASDGWTISSSDGTISGLFEETVAITKKGPVVLT